MGSDAISWAEEGTRAGSVLESSRPCLLPEQGCQWGLTWPCALQVDFPLYAPPTYSADHKDMAVQDPFSP